MNRLSPAERAVMWLARLIAGRERHYWLDAMETELVHLPSRRIDWALGSLVAAMKDRAGREWKFAFALLGLSGVAVITAGLSAVPASILAGLTGTTTLQWVPLAVLAPLPFAYLLGRIRPTWSPLWLGTTAFLAYQIAPVVVWRVMVGDGMSLLWGPNLWSWGVPYPFQVPILLLVWLTGTWWGAKAARNRAGRLSLGR
jgi:hypothetical protein